MKYKVYAKSIIGTREYQHDSYNYCQYDNSLVAVVCDGMGEIFIPFEPAKLTVDKFMNLFETKESDEEISEFFLRAIDILDENLVRIQKKAEYRKLGTTISAVFIYRNELYVLSVGDSRVYIVRGEEIVQITNDHNIEYANRINKNMESKSQRSDALISFIGAGGIKYFDINKKPINLKCKDKIFITTDGITKVLSDEEIFRIMVKSDDDAALETLFDVATSKACKSQDNTTAILINII